MDRARLRELLEEHTLLPNYALSSLPPLPQTPHHSRHLPATSSDDEQAYEPRSQRRRGPDREYPSSTRRTRTELGKLNDTLPRSNTLPTLSCYPTLSTRQSSLNTARNISARKQDFMSPPRSSALLHPSSAAEPRAIRNVSASFVLPQVDVSMLQDTTLGDLARVSLGNETMEMVARRDLRSSPVKPIASPSNRPQATPIPTPSRSAPIRQARTHLTVPTQDAEMSTFLPVSPLKTRHLLSDEYLLIRTKIEDETVNMSLVIAPTPGRAQTSGSVGKASADISMDIQQMMAKIKPEESLLDLRREIDEDQDISMIGNMLPPGLVRSKSLSRMAIKNPSPTRTLPRPTTRINPPSPIKARPIAKRVSLSVCAIPLPTATLRRLELPSRLLNPVVPLPRPVSNLPSSSIPAAKPRRGSTLAAPPRAASDSKPIEVKSVAGLRAPGRSTLPQPGSGPSARSGTQRTFGTDAAAASNRAPQAGSLVKASMGPPAKPIVPKSRTLSTPAAQSTIIGRTPIARSSALPSSTARAPTSRAPSSNLARAPPRSSPLPPTSTARAPIRPSALPQATAPTSRSALPNRTSRPPTAVNPTPPPARSMAPPGTIGRSSKSAAAAGLADIRERLDRLQARHQSTRNK